MTAFVRVKPSAECTRTGVEPFFRRPWSILKSFGKEDVGRDLVAGLTVAAVAIPQAIAYASVAELPAHCGLYTAVIAAIVGSLWGCSRFLATGPVNATSLLVLPVLLAVAAPGTPEYLLAAGVVAVIAGVLRIALALMHFGALVTLASRSVLIGFTAGAAVHIAVGQMRHLLGIDIPAMPELYRLVSVMAGHIGQSNVIAVLIGFGTLLIVIALKMVSARFPAALVAIVVSAVVVSVFGLEEQGVLVVGAIPRSLPPLTWVTTGLLPDLQLIRSLITGSMAVAALGLIEASAASQALARHSGDQINNNQEFFGQGMANIAAGLFSGYPCSGSFTRSALAQQSGARTHLTGIVTGLAILGGMLIFGPYASLIPKAAIAGVLLFVAWGMIDKAGIARVLRTSRAEGVIMGVTFLATMILPLDFAVLSGVVFSLAFFVVKSSLPRLVPVVPDDNFRHFIHRPEAPVCPQLAVMNIRGPLFFGAVYHLEEELRHSRRLYPGQTNLVLRMHGVDICDLSGIEMLESVVQTSRGLGGDVFLVRPRQPVSEVMEHSGFVKILGRDHILEQEKAIEYLFKHVIDRSVCAYECECRVFKECQTLVKYRYPQKLPHSFPRPTTGHRHHVPPRKFLELAGDEKALLLDIREPEEYQGGHLSGTHLLPLRQLLLHELPRDRHLLFACRCGLRTSRVIRMLEDQGYEKLTGLRGGILAWRVEGLPVVMPADGEELDFWHPCASGK